MTNAEILAKTAAHLEQEFKGEASGHDWWHMYRVWQLSKHIAASEPQADLFITELGALMHDIADFKFHDGDETVGPRVAREWLESLGADSAVVDHVADIVRTVSFKGANVPSQMNSIEGWIVHDADKLDAMGAMGIARTFAYGGTKGRSMYDPEQLPQEYADIEAYKNNNSSSINHFHEKLLLLKDRMHTETGKKMAQARHDYMLAFLDEFHAEWDGER
jgi:uncharacterized protein